MAPTDRIRLPLRWQFVPAPALTDGSVRWSWRAYEHNGKLALQSGASFETLSECIDHAKQRGYGQ